MRWNPRLEVAERIHCASGGVRASHALDALDVLDELVDDPFKDCFATISQ